MKTSVENKYQAFGLNIKSEVLLQELLVTKEKKRNIDVSVHIHDLEDCWASVNNGKKTVVKKDSLLFKVKNTGIFFIEKGNKILVSPLGDFDQKKLSLYILGSCIGAILLQRKILPLHGSAIAIDGKAYAIVGDSGAGKSTLASAFLKKGYQLLSDDVIPVSFSGEGVPMVTPAYPQQKLWQESLDQFEMKAKDYQPIFNRETKFKIPVEDKFAAEPLPLAGVIELSKTEEGQIKFEPIQSLERLSTLYKHTYRNFIIPRAGLTEWHFQTSAKIISQIEMHKLQRPVSTFSAHELTDVILSSIYKEANVI
ncbi:aldolase [Halobacillus sp. B29]